MLYHVKKFLAIFIGVGTRRGKLVIGPGAPESFVVFTGWSPCSVSLSFSDACQPPVCVGDVDAFDITIVPQGFIITARVRGGTRSIKWSAWGFFGS